MINIKNIYPYYTRLNFVVFIPINFIFTLGMIEKSLDYFQKLNFSNTK